MNNNFETLDSNNYNLKEINLNYNTIPSVVINRDNLSNYDNYNIPEININLEKNNDIQIGGDYQDEIKELSQKSIPKDKSLDSNLLSGEKKDTSVELSNENTKNIDHRIEVLSDNNIDLEDVNQTENEVPIVDDYLKITDTDEADKNEADTDEADTNEADTDEADTNEADTNEADTDEDDSQLKTIEEYNNEESLLHLNLGDKIEIQSYDPQLSGVGLLIYLDNKNLELKTTDNKRLSYKIDEQKIKGITKVMIKKKNTKSNLIDLFQLGVNSIIKIISKNENENGKIGKISRVIDNKLFILIDDDEIELDLNYGLSFNSDNDIYDFEIINQLYEDEIEILEDLDIVMEYEIKEENIVCSLEEGQTCLISDLMRLFKYEKNLEKKELTVSKMVSNLIHDLGQKKSDFNLDKPKLIKILNSDYVNSNIILNLFIIFFFFIFSKYFSCFSYTKAT